jgi:uracil-DNA glycosylase family 4
MARDLEPIVADLRRYLAQAAARGMQRHYLDEESIGRARERAREQTGERAGGRALRAGAARSNRPDNATLPGADPNAAPDQTRARKAQLLAELDCAQVRDCKQCKLWKSRTQTVFGVGNPDADLVFVGEAPGRDEDLQGEPFVGVAGQLLTKILGAIGFAREDVYICNVLKCRPPNNRDPQPDEVEACEPYLLQQLSIIQPKVICALGRHAAYSLLGTTESLARLRTRVHDYHGIPLVVTYHPAALLRNPQWKRPTWEDVQKLRTLHDRLVEEARGEP